MDTYRYCRLSVCALALAGLSTVASAEGPARNSETPASSAAPIPGARAVAPSAGAPSTANDPASLSEGSKDPDSGIELHGLMWLLSRTMRGQRVLAVSGPTLPNSSVLPDDYRDARTLIEKLQVIADTQHDAAEPASPWNASMIPFQVGRSYAIAPEIREAVNTDLGRLTTMDATSRGMLLADVLLRLSARQLTDLGGETGLPVSSLPRDMQAALARSFRPPLEITGSRPSMPAEASGSGSGPSRDGSPEHLYEPLDWSQVRIRANLLMFGATAPSGDFIAPPSEVQGLVFRPARDTYVSWTERGTDLPLFVEVPNSYKISDLEGRRFTQPYGASGVWKVDDVLTRLSRNTGLKLKAWPMYRQRQVFIGAPQVTNGEVLDALRLCLAASWRKLGDTYLLAWDRVPLLAIQQMAREASDETASQVRKSRARMETDAGWLQVIRSLPFASDDPMALTADQRQKLFLTVPASKRGFGQSGLPFNEMTPDQQAYIRKQAESATVPVQGSAPDEEGITRPYTEDDISGCTILPQGQIIVSVMVPGIGWVKTSEAWDSLGFSGWQMQRVASRAANAKAPDILDDAPPEVRQMLADMKPMPLPSSTRAAIVPVLGVARLNTLADEMKHRGLNVLFYPALFGGYATFSSKAFPLHPALRGEDGLAAAMAAMKAKGIQVVPYLNTLAWQNASDKVHWLSKYPQWMDLDVLGRSRAQWVTANPAAADKAESVGIGLHSYVRASEPAVEARLKVLLSEIAARPDATGVAFAEWAPVATAEFMPGQRIAPPSLGYALADRLAVFQKTGQDPADLVSWNDYLPASLRFADDSVAQQRVETPDPHNALMVRLLADAKARRKDWTTYLIDDGLFGSALMRSRESDPEEVKPKPDLSVRSFFTFMDDRGTTSGLLLPISRKNLFAVMSEMDDLINGETVPDQLMKLPSLAVYNLIFHTEPATKQLHTALVALDFRNAPEAITETMRWIEPSIASAPKPAGSKVGRPNAGSAASAQRGAPSVGGNHPSAR